MLLKGFNLIPININIAISSYNLGITAFVGKGKKNAHSSNLRQSDLLKIKKFKSINKCLL